MSVEYLRLITLLAVYALGVYIALNVFYCLALLLVAVTAKAFPGKSKLLVLPPTRFCLLIPAHNEELVIDQTLAAVKVLEYPADLVKVIVIADNCDDQTAHLAKAYDEVCVLERHNLAERGKGYALNWAIDQLTDDDEIDAFVIMDADTRMDQYFLAEMDWLRRSEKGTQFVAQGRYDVLNPNGNWRTALMAGALTLVHVVRPLARERLGFTTGLKGNGMCFDSAILRDLKWKGDSLAEDLEYTLDLIERESVRVRFAPLAKVAALMPTNNTGAASQRKRWEEGRAVIVRQRTLRLLFTGVIRLKGSLVDAGLDLLSPPLAQLGLALVIWIASIAALAMLHGDWAGPAVFAAAAALGLLVYIVGGFRVGDAPGLAYRALLFAPFYAVWKLLIKFQKPAKGQAAWVRTAREEETDHNDVVKIKS